MTQAKCSSCGAGFEVDFEPGTEFTCGACGAVVVVPAPPAPAPRPSPPRVEPSPRPRAPRAPAPPRQAHEPKAPPPPDPAKVRRQKLVMWGAIGGTAFILAVLGVLTLFKGSPAPSEVKRDEPSAAPKTSEKPAVTTPPVATSRPAVVQEPVAVRPSDPFSAARFDAAQEGAGAVEFLKFGDLAYERADQLEAEAKRFDAAALRIEALSAYGRVISREPNQERARERLGFVKYDPVEAKKIAAVAGLPRKLKGAISEAIEQIEQMPAAKKGVWPLWLSAKEGGTEDIANEWRKALREGRVYAEIEQAKLTDPFYKRAESLGGAIEGDVGPVLKKKKVEGPTFEIFARKPFVLAVQRDVNYDTAEVGDHWTEVLMQLRETFLARFRKLNLPSMDRPTPVLVLRYDTDYTKYLRRGDVKGGFTTPISSLAHFEPFSKRLVTWNEVDRTDRNVETSMSQDAVRTVVFHEGTHQLVDYYTKTRATNLDESLWFSEGIADYFGGHGRTWDETAGKWRYEPGLLNEERILEVGDKKAAGALFPLKDLLAYRRGDYERDKIVNQARTLTAYAQGWALVYLLSNWEDNKHREQFDEYVKKELNGESGVKAFEEVFGAAAVEGIENELLRMIDVLYRASKDKKIVNGKLLK